MDLESIERAILKNPKQWAIMHLELQKTLDLAITELTIHSKDNIDKPKGVFDSFRANSFIKLLIILSKQLKTALISERSKNVVNIGETVNAESLYELQNILEFSLEAVKEYQVLRGLDNSSRISKALMENNPCNLQAIESSTGKTTFVFDTVEAGIAVTIQAVKQILDRCGTGCTYEEFFRSWFSEDLNNSGLITEAIKRISILRTPESIVVRTTLNHIILTEIVTFIQYSNKVDKEFLTKNYTLDKYVAAASSVR